MNGLHDDLGVWDSVLSAAEILTLYNSGTVLDISTDSGNYASSSSLVGWWRMGDGDTIANITDNSTNSNDGTPVNMSSSDISTDVPS